MSGRVRKDRAATKRRWRERRRKAGTLKVRKETFRHPVLTYDEHLALRDATRVESEWSHAPDRSQYHKDQDRQEAIRLQQERIQAKLRRHLPAAKAARGESGGGRAAKGRHGPWSRSPSAARTCDATDGPVPPVVVATAARQEAQR